ncbi:MAG: Lipoprotein signal peptidase, partial [Pseudomonadota bacterium]
NTVASPKSRSRMSAARWMMVAALLIGLDQLSKLIIVNSYALGQQSVLTSWFNVVRVHNTGAAFSFLSDAGGWQRWFFVGLGVLAVAVLAFLMIRHAGQVLFSLAATLIISGWLTLSTGTTPAGTGLPSISQTASSWSEQAYSS